MMAAAGNVDIYSAKELQATSEKLAQKQTQFASQDLARYGNHYTMLALRDATGSSEVHEHEADIFVVESGDSDASDGRRPGERARNEARGDSRVVD